MHKAWRFYKQKENTDIMPAARALFCLFFLDSLLNKINSSVKKRSYNENYTPTLLFLGFIIKNFLASLPDPFWLISMLSFIFLIPPFKALNYFKENSPELTIIEEKALSVIQILLISLGVIFWLLVILGLVIEN